MSASEISSANGESVKYSELMYQLKTNNEINESCAIMKINVNNE
jgi:hypothetical protein